MVCSRQKGIHHAVFCAHLCIDGIDYQILVEADFLVNLYEDGLSMQAIEHAYKKIFRTDSGKNLCREIFDLHLD